VQNEAKDEFFQNQKFFTPLKSFLPPLFCPEGIWCEKTMKNVIL